MVSREAQGAMFSANTADGLLTLITITADSLSVPIRACNNQVNIVSRGRNYIAFPFAVSLPQLSENAPPRAALRISNLGSDLTRAIRVASGEIFVAIEQVRILDFDSVEQEWPRLVLSNVEADVGVVTGDLTYDLLDRELFGDSFVPSTFAGMFGG